MKSDAHPSRILLPLVLGVVGVLGACGKPSAFGPHNSLILVSSDETLWEAVREETLGTLEPTVFSVRDEKRFYVQQVDTTSTQDLGHLRLFRRVLVFGTPSNRFVREVAEEADLDGDDLPVPAVVRAEDVWAKNQIVLAVVLDPDRPEASWRAQLPELAEAVDRDYRRFVEARMYVSGVDSAALGTFERRFGFRLLFPRVYDVSHTPEGGEGPVVIRNDNPDPSQLIRSVLVDWRSPPLDSLTAEAAYAWRAAVDSVHYNVPQAIDRSRGTTRRLEQDGRPALEVTGVWSDEVGSFPAGGPFVSRLVACPGLTYFLDGWIYAPGKDKYEYLLQLRHILDSFRC